MGSLESWKSGGKAAPVVEFIPLWSEWSRRGGDEHPNLLQNPWPSTFLFQVYWSWILITKSHKNNFFISNFLHLRKKWCGRLLLQSQIISMCSERGFLGEGPPECPPGSSPRVILCPQHIFSWSVMVMLLLEINLLSKIHPLTPLFIYCFKIQMLFHLYCHNPIFTPGISPNKTLSR